MVNGAAKVALLVEGNPAVVDTILHAVTKDDLACEVVVTHDGAEALDYLLGRGNYDERDTSVMPCVVLLDLSPPRRSGLEVLRQLRATPETKLLPVVTFSSSEERQDANAIYSSGANSYIGEMSGAESFTETLRQAAHYWFVLNEPPPTL